MERITHAAGQRAGAAASLLNTGRQVGASIGLAVLGTVAWTVEANRARPAAAARAAASRPGFGLLALVRV